MDNEAHPYLLTEAAELTGLSVDALRKRIARRKIRADRSNENRHWRVWLSAADIAAAKAGRLDGQDELSSGQLAGQVDESRTIKALEGEVSALRDALGRERAAADWTRGLLEAAQNRVQEGQERLREQYDRAGRAEGERDAERAARERAETALTEQRLRADRAEAELHNRNGWTLMSRLRWAFTVPRRL